MGDCFTSLISGPCTMHANNALRMNFKDMNEWILPFFLLITILWGLCQMSLRQTQLAAKPNYSHQISHSLWLLGKLLDFKATKLLLPSLELCGNLLLFPLRTCLFYLYHIYLHILSTFQDRCFAKGYILCFSGFSTFQVCYLAHSH